MNKEKLNGSPALTEIDQKMEEARQAQEKEILHEQVRMERMHVATMAMNGLLAYGSFVGTAEDLADKSVIMADALLKRIVQ